MQADDEIKILARFTAELLAETRRRPRGRDMTWLESLTAHIDLDNPPFADGRHLKKQAGETA